MTHRQPRRAVWVVAVVLGSVLLSGRPARADFDLNGNWVAGAVVLGFPAACNIDITQVMTNLSVTGMCDFVGALSLTGTIDTMTGAFTLSGSAGAICTMAGSLMITGQASDNSNFTGTLDCSGLMGNITGSRCGNGLLDPGEQCDTGTDIGSFGNCCAAGCQFASNTTLCRNSFPCDPAEYCTGASQSCPADLKDPDGTACSTNNACLTAETCSSGICTNGTPVAAGTTCLDSVPCVDFQCDGIGGCQDVFNTDPCDDGDLCTTNDVCSEGFCASGPPLDCGACQTCDSALGCQPMIEPVCTTPTSAAALLNIKEGAAPADAQLRWKWKNGPQIDPQDFGDPRTTTSYALCVYDQDAQAPSGLRLMLEANVPPNSKWAPNAKGYKYLDSTLGADGMQLIVLKSGAAGKGKITLKAKGSNLTLANLPATPPVAVQLKSSGGACWGANYANVDSNNPVRLRGKGGP
jgi:hypothetical protein